MSKVKKKDAKKYADMWAKSKGSPKEKKEFKQFAAGKCQAKIESAYWDKTRNDTDCLKFELKILSGPDEGRTIKRTFFIQGKDDDETQVAIDRFKEEMSKLGISDLKTPDEAMDSLEECVIEISVWIRKNDPEKYPVAFFNKYIKGPDEEEKTDDVTAPADDNDDIEY